jgi:heavy metal sensor kinase
MIRSIRYTLTLWYLGILAVILSLFGWILYTTQVAGYNRGINRALVLQASSIADTIEAFWDAERSTPSAGPGNWLGAPAATLQEVFDTGQLPALVNRWTEKSDHVRSGRRAFRILSHGGAPLATSTPFASLKVPLTPSVLAGAQNQHAAYETFYVPGAERFRVLTYPVLFGGRVVYHIQVAGSLQEQDAALANLRRWLLWLVPLTLLGTIAVGWFLANQAMAPVGRMIRQARIVSAERLDQRLDVPRSGDELERLAVTFNDMLARLEHAFRRLRQFSAAASHELRTPLTVMKGELEVVLRKPRQSEEYLEVLRTHLQTIDEMSHLVEELLMLARSDAVEGAVEHRPVELGALIKQVSDIWRRVAEKKGVRLDLRVTGPVWARGEPRLLERLVSNLLDNAIRHTPAKGRVSLVTERLNNHACLVVRDTGPGISPEEMPHIFDRFFKRPSSSEGSSGLGLGLCRWIVEAHAGRIEVTSQPSKGAAFTVWLPLAPPAADQAGPDRAPASPSRAARSK